MDPLEDVVKDVQNGLVVPADLLGVNLEENLDVQPDDYPVFYELSSPERYRTYFFGERGAITVNNVVKIAVSESGTHRLELADGTKVIVPYGWLAIEFDADHWSF